MKDKQVSAKPSQFESELDGALRLIRIVEKSFLFNGSSYTEPTIHGIRKAKSALLKAHKADLQRAVLEGQIKQLKEIMRIPTQIHMEILLKELEAQCNNIGRSEK